MRSIRDADVGAHAANVSEVEGFSMRAWAQLFLLGRRWPALGNMTRRKPWGLGEPYGESGKPVLPKVLRDIEILRYWIVRRELRRLSLFCGVL